MRKLLVAGAVYLLFLPASYPMGVFHRHHDDPAAAPPASSSSRSNSSGLTLSTSIIGGVDLRFVSVAPEPETYLLMLVGIGAVAWIARNKKK